MSRDEVAGLGDTEMLDANPHRTGIVFVAIAAIALAGCASDGGDAPQSVEVDIVDFGYEPSSVEVAGGGTVTWTNQGDATHTITWTSTPDGASPPDSGDLTSGDTYQLSQTTTGTYEYECRYHAGQMQGSVTFV